MSSRIWRSTSKVAASSLLTSCGAVVVMGIFRMLAMFTSDTEIGFADMRLIQDLGRQPLRHDAPLLQDIGAIGDVEGLKHVLFHQQYRSAILAHLGDDIEHVV